MVKILYTGDVDPCTVRVRSGRIGGWCSGEVKEVTEADAKCLLVQSYFVLADGERITEKEEEPLEELEEEVPEEEPEEIDELPEEEDFDVDSALKDDLLDYTARHNIDADYSNTVKELREMIKEYMSE